MDFDRIDSVGASVPHGCLVIEGRAGGPWASLAPRRDADPAQVDAVRLRTMAITCIAGLAGLPQVSLPLAAPNGVPLGLSPLGPAGSDLALIRLAARVHAALA
jgi:amidase